MGTSVLSVCSRVFALLILLGPVIALAPVAQASTLDFASLTQLSPRQERMSELLERRFELVLSRHRTSLRSAAERCQAGERSACRLGDWKDFLAEISGDAETDQIRRVHRYVNRFRYVTDQRNWKRPDFWAMPEQLFSKGGDCEDYVIAKYVALRSFGVPAERLRVVVVYDRKKREDHAVLTVFGPSGTLVLDNHYRRIRTWADMSKRYEPYYSLNENSVWIHSAKV
jgi:predicted transglutaminase-like cysteine proteinase